MRAPSQNLKCLEALSELEAEEADKFVRRDRAYRTPTQIDAEGEKIMLELPEMLDSELRIYPNPTRDCSWQCRLWTACVQQDDGADYEHELEMSTVQRTNVSPSQDTEDDTSWRKHLPSQEEVSQLVQKEQQLGRLL